MPGLCGSSGCIILRHMPLLGKIATSLSDPLSLAQFDYGARMDSNSGGGG